jgi:hypothetical protein
MGGKRLVIVDRETFVVESPIFTSTKTAHEWGMENLTHAYQILFMIIVYPEVTA